MTMRSRHGGMQRCYRRGNAAALLGGVLIAAGLLLLFLCIPGWAWAALAGVGLIVLGYILLSVGKGGR